MAQSKGFSKESAPKQFRHPTAGAARRTSDYIAVFWREGASRDAREALINQHGLEFAELRAEQPSMLKVNQTDRLSWLRAARGKAISDDVLAKLAESELVEWVSPGFRGERDQGESTGVFTVNPTRLYVRQQAFDQAGGAAALAAGVSLDTARSRRMHNLVALNVPEMNAIAVAEQMQGAFKQSGGADIRYETIPFISPVCDAVNCKPPFADHTPDDPMFAQQWGLQRIGVPRGWQITRGSPDVTIAVIDEGVQLDHPDLLLHAQSWNASTDTPDGSPTGNHGTACAGIAAARLGNGAGVSGVAGGSRIMAIATATWADVDIAEALYFAADNGARVVSMSFGVYESWGVWDFDLIRDALQYAHDQGLLLIAASGNENGNVARFPGSDARTLCVGGSNRTDERKRIGDASSEN